MYIYVYKLSLGLVNKDKTIKNNFRRKKKKKRKKKILLLPKEVRHLAIKQTNYFQQNGPIGKITQLLYAAVV